MLPLCVLVIAFGCASANSDSWPFILADRFIEEFKSNVDSIETAAKNSQFQQSETKEQIVEWTRFDESVAITDNAHYDFIVVGGGTSGSVLASRLSEIPEWKILLLEAGQPETAATKVPRNWQLLRNTPYNWAYTTQPQNHSCLGMLEHRCTIPAGRALGGTSAINSMIYTRGNPRDYDVWADLGNKGWCFEDVLPIFKKLEEANFQPFDKKYHHRGGYQHLEHPQYLTHLSETALQAGNELDIHTVDYNGKKQVGMSIPQLTSKCGRRHSTADAFLDSTAKRPNLIVKPLSQAIKILISPHTKETYGVQYIHDGKLFVAKADKEVILSAGALATPKLLLLSGIGTKEECEKHKIDVISELKVGHNLKVRPSFIGLDFVYNTQPHILYDIDTVILDYLKNDKGPLTSPGIEALAFLKTEHSKEYSNYPDIELQFIGQNGVSLENFKWMKLSKAHYDSIWKPLEGNATLKIVVTLNHPKSTGTLSIPDANPLQNPIIEPNLLMDEDEEDYETLLAGIRKAIKLSQTKAFIELGAIINPHQIHGCEETKLESDDYWKCAMKYLVVPTEDVSGTARMGPSTDDEAVVDNKLKVYGVHKLRVADASVIPVTMTGSLIGPSILIGEQAAHFISEDWI